MTIHSRRFLIVAFNVDSLRAFGALSGVCAVLKKHTQGHRQKVLEDADESATKRAPSGPSA
jgi:hypothetical protein